MLFKIKSKNKEIMYGFILSDIAPREFLLHENELVLFLDFEFYTSEVRYLKCLVRGNIVFINHKLLRKFNSE